MLPESLLFQTHIIKVNDMILKKMTAAFMTVSLLGCSSIYQEQAPEPTEQYLNELKEIRPTGALRSGKFHMQRVQQGSRVLVKDEVILKRPDLPPFDVAYISRNVESVLLELANAAGESIVLPQGIRNRNVTIVHSGGNFQEMLDIVLSKVGYHYNYVNGVWYVTRYPVRNYQLEVGQSVRRGSLVSNNELAPEQGENSTASTSASQLDTDYSDELWDQVEDTIKEMIKIGQLDAAQGGSSSGGINGSGRLLNEGEEPTVEILAEGEEGNEEVYGTLTETGGLTPARVATPKSTDHLQPEEDAEPWYKITRSAGLITVRAAPESHRLLENYLEQVQENSFKQTYIEMRIITVSRNNDTVRGIDVKKDAGFGGTVMGSVGFQPSTAINASTAEGLVFDLFSQKSNGKKDLSAVIQNLAKVSTVHTIASPSLLARNNQLSRVSLTRQLGYAETSVDQNTTSTGDIVIGSRTDTARFKNAGTVMSVFPFIGKNRVQLRLRLSIATKSGDTQISTSVGDAETITNAVPELQNNVIDQDMVLEYGRVYAIGSLVQTSNNSGNDYVPGLNNIPGMREILSRASNNNEDTEFVVLLRVSRA